MEEKTKLALLYVELGLGISLLLMGIYMYSAGFHNVDLAINMQKISCTYNLDYQNWVDQYKIGKYMGYDDSYILGQDYIQYSIFVMLIAGILLGSSLNQINNRLENGYKKSK